ncbi:HAD family hydrolase [Colwelliaceae bacterium BS250]
MTLRIAMWSGPRNISTAMMRSWENRSDATVIDEPFYAYYLAHTNTPHPMQDEILASQPNKWQDVVRTLISDVEQNSDSSDISYQKHMTHHMLDDINLDWANQVRHCFLIRDPAFVINSYIKKMPSVCSQDIGIERQYQLYQQLSEITGQDIPIIDSSDVLNNPQAVLSKLCDKLGITFSSAMLNWPQGPRSSDGVWAKHWYENVEASTGFAKYTAPKIVLTAKQQALAEENNYFYQKLFNKRIKVE